MNRHAYNSCILPAMPYGAETLTITKYALNKFTEPVTHAAAHTYMGRSMLNITYKPSMINIIWV